jgi:hypothetical protein
MTGQIDNPYQLINLRGAGLAAVETLTLAGEKPENPEFLDANSIQMLGSACNTGAHSNNSFAPLIRHPAVSSPGELRGRLAIQKPAVIRLFAHREKDVIQDVANAKMIASEARVSSDW